MQQILQVREFPARTLKWWYDEQHNIEFNPSYQRKGGIWNDTQKAFLIDTILNGFDVPKIYLADFTYRDTPLNSANKPYAVIDGKQRFKAIFDFFEDKFSISNSFIFLEDPKISIKGLKYSELLSKHPRIARIFDNSGLTVMSVITGEESLINELFVRLNTSKPLTGAEVRSAMVGEVPQLIKKISSHVFFSEYASFPDMRKQDENLAAKLLLLEFRGKFIDTKKKNLDNLINEAKKEIDNSEVINEIVDDAILAETPTLAKAEERVIATLDNMVNIFAKKDPILKNEGQIPLYYWLCRNESKINSNILGDFLRYFNHVRMNYKSSESKEQLINNQTDPESINLINLLNYYDVRARSINDATSLSDMYEILNIWLKHFANGPIIVLSDISTQ